MTKRKSSDSSSGKSPKSGRIQKRPPVILLVVALVFVLGILRLGQLAVAPRDDVPTSENSQSLGLPASLSQHRVTQVLRVVDGDTVIVRGEDGRNERVRLLGINCPETKKENRPYDEPFAVEATEFTRKLVDGKTVTLTFDHRLFDQYDRTLAYINVDNLQVNEEIIRQGLAKEYAFDGDSPEMARRFRAAEREAKQAGRGIWSQ